MEVKLNSGNVELTHVKEQNGEIHGNPRNGTENWSCNMYYTLQRPNGDELLAELTRVERSDSGPFRLVFEPDE